MYPVRFTASASSLSAFDRSSAGFADLPRGVGKMVFPRVPVTFVEVRIGKFSALHRHGADWVGHLHSPLRPTADLRWADIDLGSIKLMAGIWAAARPRSLGCGVTFLGCLARTCPWWCWSPWCSSTLPGCCPRGVFPWASCVRGWARCGVVVAGTTCGQIPRVITARRAAASVAGQAEGRERASAAPGDEPSRGRTVTRFRMELPGCADAPVLAAELADVTRSRKPDDLVFTTASGSVIRLSNWRRSVFLLARRQAGISKPVPHSRPTAHRRRTHGPGRISAQDAARDPRPCEHHDHARPERHLYPGDMDKYADRLDDAASDTNRRTKIGPDDDDGEGGGSGAVL